jgi:hypothetical protein
VNTGRPAGRPLADGPILPCALLSLLSLAVALSPRAAGPLSLNLAALGLLAPLSLWTVLRRPPFGLPLLWPVVLAFGSLAIFGLSSSLAVNPNVSLFGLALQHDGWLFWALLSVWFSLVVMGARSHDHAYVAKTIAVLGGLAAVTGLLDLAGLAWSSDRYSLEPAGALENSSSLAQVVVLALGCATGWALAQRGTRRALPIAMVLVLIAGLFLTDTLAGYAGVALALVVLAFDYLGIRRPSRFVPVRILILFAAGVTLVLVFAIVLAIGFDADAMRALNSAAGGRLATWRGLLFKVGDQPVVGAGLDQFGVVIEWTINPEGFLDTLSTRDPHNLLLLWLHSGGAAGLAAALGMVSYVLWKLDAVRFAAYRSRGNEHCSERSMTLGITMGLVAWGVTLAFTWTSVLAAMWAATLVGSLVGPLLRRQTRILPTGGKDRTDERGWKPWELLVPAGMAAVAVLVIAGLWTPIRHEYAFIDARDQAIGDGARAQTAYDAYAGWPDPTYAKYYVETTLETLKSVPPGQIDLGLVERTLERSRPDAAWNSSLALAAAGFQQQLSAMTGRDTWNEYQAFLGLGEQAQPRSGLWPFLRAAEANRLGLNDVARESAKQTLDDPLAPADVRGVAEQWAGGSGP